MLNKTNSFFKQGLFGLCLLALLSAGTGCKGKSDKDSEKEKEKDGGTTSKTGITYVRKNASLPEAKADLDALNKALDSMRKLPCDNPISWYYQGAIHWVPDTINGTNKLCSSYQNISQLKTAWDECTHVSGSTYHFLIWHRMYIWYLEKIVRKLSGKTDFALPYWDYVDAKYRVMPDLFRQAGAGIYTDERIKLLNQGQPINLSYANQYLVAAMTKNNGTKSYGLFNSGINAAPHGAMHNYIGGAADGYPGYEPTMYNSIYQDNSGGQMANVPSAGFDPIFWAHHSNIDYLWTVWNNSSNGQAPILSQMEAYKQKYIFFDENGKKVDLSIQQVYDTIFHLDYTYQGLVAEKPAIASVSENRKEIFSLDRKDLVSKPTQMLALPVEDKVENFMETVDLSRKSTVLVVTVSYKTQPKQNYAVYIDTDKPDEKKLAGFMTFFGAKLMLTMQGMAGMESTEEFQFDISDEFDLKAMKDNVKLLIVAPNGKPASEITIKKVRVETIDF